MMAAATPGARKVPRSVREPQMLDAAEQVFAERGFYAASMDEIAELAGTSKRMVYSYFGSKEDLYVACMERACDRLFDRMAAATRAAPRPELGLLHAELAFFRWVDENRGAWSILYGLPARGEPFGDALGRIRRKQAQVIVDLISEAAVAMGLEPPDRADTEQVAYVLLGAGESLADWWLRQPDVSRETAAKRVATLGGHAINDLLRRSTRG